MHMHLREDHAKMDGDILSVADYVFC
uniref:Uncharacterized protein n=1 Tax=Anguilla anguilla TaxID=7936 RepID=A0A0E9TSU1_ANGAN